jgi:hypothetical protein
VPLLEDRAQTTVAKEDIADMGTIRIEICRIRVTNRFPDARPDTAQIGKKVAHEKDKKVGAHCVG